MYKFFVGFCFPVETGYIDFSYLSLFRTFYTDMTVLAVKEIQSYLLFILPSCTCGKEHQHEDFYISGLTSLEVQF